MAAHIGMPPIAPLSTMHLGIYRLLIRISGMTEMATLFYKGRCERQHAVPSRMEAEEFSNLAQRGSFSAAISPDHASEEAVIGIYTSAGRLVLLQLRCKQAPA